MAKQIPAPAHSQPPAQTPAPLTKNTAAFLAAELRRVEAERANKSTYRADLLRKQEELARQRDELGREIDGTDTVLALLDGTADWYRRQLSDAGYPLQDTAVWPLPGQQEQRGAVWNGGDAPHTGLIAAVPAGAPTDNPPIGHCHNCGQPVWRDTNEKGEKEIRHAIGSLCFPNDPASPVARFDEAVAERPS